MPLALEPAEGYFVDTPVAAPAEVTLRGPESQMNQVDKVVANVAISGQRTESALATAQLEFGIRTARCLPTPHITADAEQVEVTIPVLKMKEVPITFEYTRRAARATIQACWAHSSRRRAFSLPARPSVWTRWKA